MKVKHIINTSLMCATAAMLSTSCTFEQEDYFDESASLRITHLNEDIQSRLVNQSTGENNGWVIQYFVAGTDEMDFEGFNLFGRFYKNNTVTLASNHRYLRNGNANKYTEHTSHYEMLAEEGPVLSFNTWNDILTVFEDPVSPTSAPGSIEQDGVGMNGDHNLVLKSYNENEIVFRGERHSALVRFVPCDRSFEEYIDAVNEFKNSITSNTMSNFIVTNGTDTMYFAGLNKGLFGYYDRLVDPLKRKTLSCVFTPNGFLLNHVDSLGTQTFQEFTMAEDKQKLLSEDGLTKVVSMWENYVLTNTTLWKFDTSVFSAEQTSLFEQINEEIKKHNANWSLESIGMGKSSGGGAVNGLVFTFYTNAAKTRTNTAGLALTKNKAGEAQIQIIADPSDKIDNNMTTICKKATNLETLARSFAATLNGTYSVTPDNYFIPTGGTYTAVNGGTTFVLAK